MAIQATQLERLYTISVETLQTFANYFQNLTSSHFLHLLQLAKHSQTFADFLRDLAIEWDTMEPRVLQGLLQLGDRFDIRAMDLIRVVNHQTPADIHVARIAAPNFPAFCADIRRDIRDIAPSGGVFDP